jgi:outer membrane protein assembly factor BamD
MKLKKLLINKLLKNNLSVLFVSTMLIVLNGCAKQKPKEETNDKTLKNQATAFLNKKKYDDATEVLQKIINKYPDHADITTHKLLLADTYFTNGKYLLAFQLYDHYNQYYPANENAEYAKYRSILSKFYQTLKTDCDQTVTTDTIKLCKEYSSFSTYKKYSQDVNDIQNTCEHKLINKEIYVYNFYLNQGEYKAAYNRIKHLRDTFVSSKKSIEPRLLYLECKLAQKQKHAGQTQKIIEQLVNIYPESQYTQMAQALTAKNNFTF